LSDGRPQLVVDVLAVEAELVEHADEESILLLRVVLTLVGAVLDTQLVERRTVPSHLTTATIDTLMAVNGHISAAVSISLVSDEPFSDTSRPTSC